MEKSNKLQSRKFGVWIVWTVFAVIILICNFVRGGSEAVTLEVIKDHFFVSMVYLGANVANKGIMSWKEIKEVQADVYEDDGNNK